MDARNSGAHRDQPTHGPERTPDEARQGVKTGYMRRVLGVSLVLAVIVVIGAWLWSDRPKPATAPAPAPAASSPPGAPILPQREHQRATTPPTPAAPQSSPALP